MVWLVYIFILISIIVVDQLSKNHAIKYGKKIIINRGAFLGLFKRKLKLLFLFQFIAIIILFYLFFYEDIFIQRLLFSFIIAGALSNEYEHIKKSGVTDFIKISKFYINVADIAIFMGLIGYVIYSLLLFIK